MRKEGGGLLRWMRSSSGSFNKSDGVDGEALPNSVRKHVTKSISQEAGQPSASKEMTPKATTQRDLTNGKRVTDAPPPSNENQPKQRKVYRVGARPIIVKSGGKQLNKTKSTSFAGNRSTAEVERFIHQKLTGGRSSSLPTIRECASRSLETSGTLSSSNRSGDSGDHQFFRSPTSSSSDSPLITPFPSLTYNKRGLAVNEEESLDYPVAPERATPAGEEQQEANQIYSARIEEFDAVLFSSPGQLVLTDSPGLTDSARSISAHEQSDEEKYLASPRRVDDGNEDGKETQPSLEKRNETSTEKKRSDDVLSTPKELTQKESEFLQAAFVLPARPPAIDNGEPRVEPSVAIEIPIDLCSSLASLDTTDASTEDDAFRKEVKSFVHDYVLENPSIVDNALGGSIDSVEFDQNKVVIIGDFEDPLADLNMRTMKSECYDGPIVGSTRTGTEDNSQASSGGDESSSIRSRSSSIPSRSSSVLSKYSLAPDVASDLYDNLYSSPASANAPGPSSPVPPLPPPPRLPRAYAYPKKQQHFERLESLVGFDSDDGTEMKDNTRLAHDPKYRHSLKHITDCIWAALGDDDCEVLDLGNQIRIDKDSTRAIKEESDDHLDSSTIADYEEEEGWLSTEDPWPSQEEEIASYTTDEAVIYTTRQGQRLPSAKEIMRAAQEKLRIERSQSLLDDGDDPLESTLPRRNTSDRSGVRSRYADASDRSGQSRERSVRDRSARSRYSDGGRSRYSAGGSSGRDSSGSSYGSYLAAPRGSDYYEASSSEEEEDDEDCIEQDHDPESNHETHDVRHPSAAGDDEEDDEMCEGYNASADLAKDGAESEDEVSDTSVVGVVGDVGVIDYDDRYSEFKAAQSGDRGQAKAPMLETEGTTPTPSLPYTNDAVVEYSKEDIDDDVSSLGSHLSVLVSAARRRQELQLEKERVELELKKLELKDATRRRNLLMPATMSPAQRLAGTDIDKKLPPSSLDSAARETTTEPSLTMEPFPLAEISVKNNNGIEKSVDEDGEEKSIYDTRDIHPSPISVVDYEVTPQSNASKAAKEEWDRCNRQVQEMQMYPPKLD